MNNTNELIDKDLRLELSQKIFIETGHKVVLDDPIIDIVVIIEKLLQQKFDTWSNDIYQQHLKLLKEFDERADELDKILSQLDDRKEIIVAEVWQKLEFRVADKVNNQVHSDLHAMSNQIVSDFKNTATKIANGANNNINNQRNMLIGGCIGLVIGLLCCMILFLFK